MTRYSGLRRPPVRGSSGGRISSRGLSSVGRALSLHGRCQGFDSPRLHSTQPLRPAETQVGGVFGACGAVRVGRDADGVTWGHERTRPLPLPPPAPTALDRTQPTADTPCTDAPLDPRSHCSRPSACWPWPPQRPSASRRPPSRTPSHCTPPGPQATRPQSTRPTAHPPPADAGVPGVDACLGIKRPGEVERHLPGRTVGRPLAAGARTGPGAGGTRLTCPALAHRAAASPPPPIRERYTAEDLGWERHPHTPCGQ